MSDSSGSGVGVFLGGMAAGAIVYDAVAGDDSSTYQ
jgi:hypothetical protein